MCIDAAATGAGPAGRRLWENSICGLWGGWGVSVGLTSAKYYYILTSLGWQCLYVDTASDNGRKPAGVFDFYRSPIDERL